MEQLKTETKVCTKCNQEKELCEYYSQMQKRAKGKEVRIYQSHCKKCISEKNKLNAKTNYEKEKEYRRRNPEASRRSSKVWNEKNKNKITKDQKDWRQSNPEKIKEYNQKRKEKQFKLSTKEWNACKQYFNNSCSYCGISERETKETYNKGLHKEHAINEGANDLSNCITACTKCNSSKRDSDYIDWYTENNSAYDQGKMNLIEQWLKEDYKQFIKNT